MRRRTRRLCGRRGLHSNDPCREQETVPGWMRIQCARATGLLAPCHLVAGGPVGYKHGMRDGMGARGQDKGVARAAQQPLGTRRLGR